MWPRTRRTIGVPAIACLVALIAAAAPPPPPPPTPPPVPPPIPTPQEAAEAERARDADLAMQKAAADRARAAADREQALGQARVATAAKLRAAEEALDEAAAKIADLTLRRRDAETRLAARAAALAPVLPVIERLSLYPAETLLAVPMPPEDAVRGVLVLGGLARTLEHDAAALRAEQAEVASLRAEVDAELPNLAAARAAQMQLGQQLDAQLAEARRARRGAEDAATEAARKVAAEAARADSIRNAIARIETERRAAEAQAAQAHAAEAQTAETQTGEARTGEAKARPSAAAPLPLARSTDAAHTRQEAFAQPTLSNMTAPRGQLTAPVAGVVVRSFGAETEAGPASGLSYASPPNARVVSPCGGRIVFAGPFRSFGLLLIVDCGSGYHFVMSGLERLDGQVGQPVQPGEPVGIMPAWDPQSRDNSRPTLYVELRKDGVPVNPAPFLRARL